MYARITPADIHRHQPDLLMPATSRECAPLYWDYVRVGEELARRTDATFLGLARNSMPFIQMNTERLEQLGGAFKSWRAFVYENDSDDGTDDTLRQWAEPRDNVEVCCVRHDRPQLSHEKSSRRTHALAEYRQACLEWARKRQPSTGRHVIIVVDLDTWGGWSNHGVMTGLRWLDAIPDAAGMASVSTVDMPLAEHPGGKLQIHYDSWAFRLNHWHEHDMGWFPHWWPPVGSEPVPCRSAFGGMTVYRPEAFFAGHYSGGDCEHVAFHRSILKQTGLRMFLNPSQRMVMNWLPEVANGGQHGDD